MLQDLVLINYNLGLDASRLSPSAGLDLYLQEYERYASAMDSTEEEGGVNSYASTVLKSLSDRSNRSKEWSSSLTDHSRLTSLPCVQKFLMDTQVRFIIYHIIPFDRDMYGYCAFQKK